MLTLWLQRTTPFGNCGRHCDLSELPRKKIGDRVSRTGREIVLERLHAAMRRATTADLQRAALFLEWAWDVRRGCSRQRAGARKAQGQAWKKTVDEDVRW